MTRPSEINHEYFEELGALSALAQITPQEFKELQSHLISCPDCRFRQEEFMEILHEHLPLLAMPGSAGEGAAVVLRKARNIRHRFMEKASHEGLRFSDEAWRVARKDNPILRNWVDAIFRVCQPARLAYGLALGVLCLVTGLLGIRLHQSSSNYEEAKKELAIKSAEVTRLNAATHRASEFWADPSRSSSVHGVDKQASKGSPEVQKLETELRKARRDYENALDRAHSLDEQMQRATAEIAGLKSELVAAQSNVSSGNRLRDAESAFQQANEEIARLRQGHALQVAALTNQQNQIRELTSKLYSQKENLDQHRDLLATTLEIRELMGARNLHIIDVADVDSRGTRKPFGRVFYTEGRSLVFYAYDLEKKRKSIEKFCFQAWGQVESKTGSVQNLGVFSADDQAQNRWVLKYDDPSVLARIDSVFVTVEPVGGSLKPKGQQLMYAYLKANPNHP